MKQQITDKINVEETSGIVYRAEEDTNAVVIITQPKRDRLRQPRFLLDYSPRNVVTIGNDTLLPNIAQGIKFVAARSYVAR